MFLMHRVELKGFYPGKTRELGSVPNAPCGVERRETAGLLWSVPLWFLMHRVELKAISGR